MSSGMATEGTVLRMRGGACPPLKHCVGYTVPVSQHFTNEGEGGPYSGLGRGFKEISRKYLDPNPAV